MLAVIARPSVSLSPAWTVYENTNELVVDPLAYVAYLLERPASGIRGVPVTVTAAENVTVTDTASPALYVLSAPAEDVKPTDDTVGPETVEKFHEDPADRPPKELPAASTNAPESILM